MDEDADKRLVRWPLVLISCLLVFLVWPAVGFAYAMAAFEIEGDATGVAPGVTVPIELSFINKHPKPMSISRLRVTVQGLSAPAADDAHPCVSEDFELTQIADSAAWSVPPRTTLSLVQLGVPRADWPQITMRDRPVNQDGCKGAVLTLGYTAHGVLGR